MNPSLKNFLLVVFKNAVNAVLTNAALMVLLHGAFNTNTSAGWWNLGKATLSVIVGREAAVWIPIVLKWSNTNGGGTQ